jgi:hypothetical protein
MVERDALGNKAYRDTPRYSKKAWRMARVRPRECARLSAQVNGYFLRGRPCPKSAYRVNAALTVTENEPPDSTLSRRSPQAPGTGRNAPKRPPPDRADERRGRGGKQTLVPAYRRWLC